MKTGIIKYNVKDRGREHRGHKRIFDSVGLADMVNCPAVQERVKNRDLIGYLGHWTREMFGMEPPEGAIHNGKPIVLEPAFVTTYVHADADGNIEHEAETMDNLPGQAVERYIKSRVGGFSSAVLVRPQRGVDCPVAFHGFDYVREPNFSTNRPYDLAAMDSVAESTAPQWAFDGVLVAQAAPMILIEELMEESGAAIQHLQALYDSVTRDHGRAMQLIERLTLENNDLLSRAVARLDGVTPFAKPLRAAVDTRMKEIAGFLSEPLAALDSVPNDEAAAPIKGARAEARAAVWRR